MGKLAGFLAALSSSRSLIVRPSNSDITKKLKMWQNLKTQINQSINQYIFMGNYFVMKHMVIIHSSGNSNWHKTQKLKLWQLENLDSEKIQSLKLWQNSKTQIRTKLQNSNLTILKNSNCDVTWKSLNCDKS